MILLTLTIYSSEHDSLLTVYANTWHTENGHESLLYEIFGLTTNTKAIISILCDILTDTHNPHIDRIHRILQHRKNRKLGFVCV